MYNQTIYEIDDVKQILIPDNEAKLDIANSFSTKPLNNGKGINLPTYGDPEERDFISRFEKYITLTHTTDIKPATAFLAQYNQYYGDFVSIVHHLMFDLKVASAPAGSKGMRHDLPTYFAGSIEKESLKVFGRKNHFYITMPMDCKYAIIVDANKLSKYVVDSNYKYSKVGNADFVILNDIPRTMPNSIKLNTVNRKIWDYLF